MKITVITIFLAASLIGCSYHDLDCTKNANLFESEVTLSLRNGEVVCNPDNGLAVRFQGVIDDSRCPVDAQCIWAGQVTVLISALKGEKAVDSLEISTLHPTGTLNVLGNNYTITLLHVNPPRYTTKSIKPSDYILALEVKPGTE